MARTATGSVLGLLLFGLFAPTRHSAADQVQLYGTGFEQPTFVPDLFDQQDEWFAALGLEAATVSPELPRNGAQGLRIQGSLADEVSSFLFASYARPLPYDPMGAGTPLVSLSGNINLVAGDPTCGGGIGLTSLLGDDPVTNIQIGLREQGGGLREQGGGGGTFVSYLSNLDNVFVNGPAYELGQWAQVTAVLDFRTRTVTGLVNGAVIGEVPFSEGVSNDIHYINVFLGSSGPMPNTVAYVDDVSVTAVPEPAAHVMLSAVLLSLAAMARRKQARPPRPR